jgi:sterol desaturase/sphingolipid hydroxylase (fatty acid hydroxylase superfamily)
MLDFITSIQPSTWGLFGAFSGLVGLMMIQPGGLKLIAQKTFHSWTLDGASLLVQGTLIPFLQVAMIAGFWALFFPDAGNRWDLHPALAFGVCFVGIDYLYYWNHRLLHWKPLWPIHVVHHSAEQMDVFTTSRNTLWSSFFIIYLWLNGTMLYFLAEPATYLGAMTLTFSLDLWRHSPVHPPRWLARVLGRFLIMPRDHAWHHSRDVYDVNFGANLNFWDRLHGTWHDPGKHPESIGVDTELSLAAKLLWPFEKTD